MALIKCPECGGEISSNAKQCVKCGCEITCCPECLTVYKGRVDVCSVCGYSFQPEKENVNTLTEVQTDKIERQIASDNKTVKKFSISAKIIEIATSLIAVIGIILYFRWELMDNAYEKLTQMKSLFDGLSVIAVIGLTLFILSFSIDVFVSYFLRLRRTNWLQYQKFDYKTYIKEYNSFGAGSKETRTKLELIKQAAFMVENPNEKFFSGAIIILQVALYLIVDICACVWFVSNLNNLYMVKFISLGADYTWKFGEASFILAIIFLVAAILVDIFADMPQENRYKKWCSDFES